MERGDTDEDNGMRLEGENEVVVLPCCVRSRLV